MATPALTSQTAPPVPAPDSSFGESIDVRVVNVEAVVTDRKGNRVQGLTAADFRLLVDGREVPIDYFTEVQGGEAAASSPAQKEGAPAAASPVEPGEKVGTNYLVFIDDQFSIAAPRNLVLQRLAADLKRLGPQDRMAVVAFNGSQLERLSDWTADRQTLAQAFAAGQTRPSYGIEYLAERRSELGGGGGFDFDVSASAAVHQFWEMGIGMQAVVAAMRGTPAPAGRKVMILLNGGWGVPDVPQRRLGAPSAVDFFQAEELFAPIFDTANLLGYTLYTVDVQGMDPDSVWADARQTGPVEHAFITNASERGVHEALEVVARETGGKAMFNSARLDALARVAADTSSYYWLGFTPQWKADGKHHDVRLEARRTGLAVRARTGFSDLSREEEAQLQAASQVLYRGMEATAPLAVTAGATRRSGWRTLEMPLAVEIPVAALTPLPAEGGWNLAANVSIAVLEGGSVESAKWKTLPVRIHTAALPEAGGSLRWQTLLKLHSSARKLLVILGGDRGEVLGRTEVAVRPPEGE